MTTRIELTYQGQDLTVTGSYIKAERQWFNPVIGVGHPGRPSGFEIERIEQDGKDVTASIPVQELDGIKARALEIVEDS